MPSKGYLVLEDGTVYRGEPFGAPGQARGEVVFNTSMTGYQEVLTDPSYAGQIVVLTYPLVGNYGINLQDFESKGIQVAGLVVRGWCDRPSHGLSTATLHEFLESQGVPGLHEVDTRAVTRRLRSGGVVMGAIHSDAAPGDAGPSNEASTASLAEAVLAGLRETPSYGEVDYVRAVTTGEPYTWEEAPSNGRPRRRILVADLGLKYNILRLLSARGCTVTAVSATTSAGEMLSLEPDGVVLSPGPGDPALLDQVVENARGLLGRVPIMGICLGHQILARALGASTFKLKFGHRGANHPVKDLATGRVYVTSQNHGYAVDGDSLPNDLEVAQVNLNDGTVEGLRHRDLPIFTIQYHSEGSPGPRDNEYLFDRFLDMVDGCGGS